jgi:DNA-binding transcriptional ArsR family regulator
MLNEEEQNRQQVQQDLMLMYKAGLIDVRMREDGQWVYFATDYSKSLSDEELNEILENLHLNYDEI